MRRWMMLPLITTGLAVAAGLAWLSASRANAEDAGAGDARASGAMHDARVKWEYAQLVRNGRGARLWQWSALGGGAGGDSPGDLLRGLGDARGEREPRADLTDLLNRVGRDGWELVALSGIDDGTQTWVFKRRVEPG